MISQYRVTAIVMLTKLVEKGVERCTQYWPEKLNVSEQYGDFEVTLKEQQKCGDYIKRTFELVQNGVKDQYTSGLMLSPGIHTPGTLGNRKRPLTVTQYYYPEWPDKDTPSTDPMSILHLIRDVNAAHLQYQYPIVVHCSAGVGRTGTYITLDAMMEKINVEGRINIFSFISKIRERRQYLVQTSKQYVFIHEALYEYCMYGFTDVEASKLGPHMKFLEELSPINLNGNLLIFAVGINSLFNKSLCNFDSPQKRQFYYYYSEIYIYNCLKYYYLTEHSVKIRYIIVFELFKNLRFFRNPK